MMPPTAVLADTPPMRILHVLDHSIPLHSGYTFRTRAILQEQRHLGWETFHLTGPKQGPSPALYEEVEDLRFFRTPPSVGPAARIPALNQVEVIRTLARRLETVARELRPDVIHAHSPALNGVAALRVGRRLGIPVVYEVRAFWEDAAVDHGTSMAWGPRYLATRALESYVLRRASAVTTICQGLRQDIVRRGIPEGRVTVIPNAVNIATFRTGESPDPLLSDALGLKDCTVVGFIGSFYAYEGLGLLLEAVARLAPRMPQLRALLVGGGSQFDPLRQRAEALGIADRVVFTGRVPHQEVPHYYNLVDLLVYPRLSMRLTDLVTPLKPLEAMAQGRLVLASDVGGHRELIRDGETAWLFRAGDAVDLAETIERVLSSRERWPAVRAQARRFVEEERSWAGSVARYAPVYAGLAGGAVPVQPGAEVV